MKIPKGFDVMVSVDKRRASYTNAKNKLKKKITNLKKLGVISSYKFKPKISKKFDGSSIYYPNRKHSVFNVKM